ncbi:hypothetical protein JD844_020678 [Phrynosoma platyrhinos]|uniref:C2H2-type domain-containing protein n=1 Tax=Phrynosoma platyrhinos TaxID=52577 RepID=A0ABQ7SSQ1_PHRPL|nr:hypothetical protein JD844_020678 [Phrynosoma platyrhinos]
MAAPEINGAVEEGSVFEQEEAARSGTGFGRGVSERPLEAAGEGPRELLGLVPPSAPGKEAGKAAEEMSAGPRAVVEAAASFGANEEASSSAQDDRGLLSHSPAACVSAAGSLPPESGISAAQRLHGVVQRMALHQGRSGEEAVAATRLLPLKQLETLCVQVQPEKTKEDKSALRPVMVHPKNVTIAQPVEKNSNILGLCVNPQIIQICPVMGTASQQFFLHNSSESTVQLLLHSSLNPLGQISVSKITTLGQKNNPAAIAPADSPNDALISENSLINHEKKQKEQKIKKSLKVKTRSGRISRPPKYKAKDYKFIKTEDLADCHQSDSDDYSELSLEDDEVGTKMGTCSLFDSLEYDLRPKLFKCQSCEKSYIGQGGLARHYKLNPDHGQQESQSSLINRPHRKTSLEYTGKSSSESTQHFFSPPPITIGLVNENGSGIDIELEKGLLKENERQLTQQCANEDLMELALLRFTKLVTVFEFLLMKVEQKQKYKKKALFPDVYREFEELHAVVKRMCQDYFGNSKLNEPIEIKNPKVAESLGITDSFLVLKKTQANCSSECIKTTGDHVLTETVGQKHAAESSDEMLPSAKKSRVEHLLENMNTDYSNHSGIKEGSSTYKGGI